MRASDESCMHWVDESGRHMVWRISCPGRSAVSECDSGLSSYEPRVGVMVPASSSRAPPARDIRWSRREWGWAASGDAYSKLVFSSSGNGNSIVLSHVKTTLPRWFFKEHANVKSEFWPSDVLRLDLITKLRVNVSPGNAGQWYVAFLKPTCTLAASACDMLPVRKSMSEKGSRQSWKPIPRAKGVEVLIRSFEWKQPCQKSRKLALTVSS
mmetsp:Transcript_46460/g.129457  ORF Transcript_46460/g.129457 Transcript_46460/m.129457 type:complete len:211 (-) Transcript_46460:574-1206(-)